MNLSVANVLLVLAAGLVCGFINSIAGAGSLLTLPVLIFVGLPPVVANGTNRVAIEANGIVSILGYRSKGVSDFRLSIQLALPALAGAVLGAFLALDTPDATFKKVLAIVMVVMLGLILYNPARRLKKRGPIELTLGRKIVAMVACFAAGIFGGYIQAGVGIILLAILAGICGIDLVHANAHKMFIISFFTLAALAIFVWGGKVNWVLGAILAVSNALGGWMGSRMAVTKGERWIQGFVVVAVLAFALKLSGLIPFWS